MGVRHMDGCALVPDVNDADALPSDMIPDRLNVAALQAENAVDAPRLQKSATQAAQDCSSAFKSWVIDFLPFQAILRPHPHALPAIKLRSQDAV